MDFKTENYRYTYKLGNHHFVFRETIAFFKKHKYIHASTKEVIELWKTHRKNNKPALYYFGSNGGNRGAGFYFRAVPVNYPY